jgi:putative oxygen-independent coproporphyrinogen III oxidase
LAEPLAVYVHWPFCASKCPYCDFNSHVRETVDQRRWRDALLRELAQEAALLPGRRVTSLFLGGGTPSLMPPDTVAAVITAVRAHWPTANNLEITLEANPNSVEADKFAAFADAGVNRVSLGVQALHDHALKFLGRYHSAAEALRALEIAQRNFARVSFDLIYARPGQTLADWRAELAQALGFGTEHLSLYQLTIEPGTAFAEQYKRGRFQLPDEDLAADLFALTQDMTNAAGMPLYEISNHARPDAQARHNLAYWTYADYIGVGPGAHGRRLGLATTRLKKPEAWLDAVEAQGHALEAQTPLSVQDRAQEALLMGLRLADGIDAALFQQRTGVALDTMINQAAKNSLMALGFVDATPTHLRATPKGWPLLNSIIAELAA